MVDMRNQRIPNFQELRRSIQRASPYRNIEKVPRSANKDIMRVEELESWRAYSERHKNSEYVNNNNSKYNFHNEQPGRAEIQEVKQFLLKEEKKEQRRDLDDCFLKELQTENLKLEQELGHIIGGKAFKGHQKEYDTSTPNRAIYSSHGDFDEERGRLNRFSQEREQRPRSAWEDYGKGEGQNKYPFHSAEKNRYSDKYLDYEKRYRLNTDSGKIVNVKVPDNSTLGSGTYGSQSFTTSNKGMNEPKNKQELRIIGLSKTIKVMGNQLKEKDELIKKLEGDLFKKSKLLSSYTSKSLNNSKLSRSTSVFSPAKFRRKEKEFEEQAEEFKKQDNERKVKIQRLSMRNIRLEERVKELEVSGNLAQNKYDGALEQFDVQNTTDKKLQKKCRILNVRSKECKNEIFNLERKYNRLLESHIKLIKTSEQFEHYAHGLFVYHGQLINKVHQLLDNSVQ